MSNTNPARGMRDFLPEDIRKRDYVIGVIREVYEKYGFAPLETPAVENLSTLTNKYGEEGDQLMYKILKRGEKLTKAVAAGDESGLSDLALRYDLTVPLARVIANRRNDLPRFFKRYQIQSVWRADRPAKGRYREFYQCDADAIGSTSNVVEAELALAAIEILDRLGFEDFVVRVNDRNLLFALLEASGIQSDLATSSLVALDKLDKIGVDGVKKELLERGIAGESAAKLLGLFEEIRDLSSASMIAQLGGFVADTELGKEALNSLAEILAMVNDERIQLDPSLARGLSYYTGAIFEIGLMNGDFSGSIAGGGRYDELIGMFGKEQIPAAGISLGLERLIYVMQERAMFPDNLKNEGAGVLITVWSEGTVGVSLELAQQLRRENIACIVYPQGDKLGKQFKYADQIGARTVCVVGEQELTDGTVTVKNLETGEQETKKREELVEFLKQG